MPIPTVSLLANNVLRKLPLRLVLTLPFVVQTVGAVTLVGYLSYRSGQQAVADLASQLMQEKGDRIVQNLEYYLKAPKNLVRENQSTIKLRILDWQNTSLMQTYFTQQLKIHTDVSGLMISTQRKDFLAVGHPHPNQFVIRQRNLKTGALENYTADLQGNRLYLQDNLPNYDPHADPPTNPWYTAAKKSQEGFWQLVVSLVRGKDDPILMMAYFLPFADSQGEFQGVLSSSVYLDRAGTFLRTLQIGKTGQAFIIDEKGLLIATSTTEAPFRWKRSIKPKETLPPEVLRLAAQDSQNPVTRTAAAWSLNQRDSLDNDSHLRGFRLHNQQYFGRVIPFQLDNHIRWTIVVVVPESDFMAQIQANVYRTVLLCGLALLGAIGSGIWTSKRITRSLFRLTQATQTVAAGTLDARLPTTRIAEVENLTASFRQMMIELQQANQLRQNYAQQLERQVAEKTALLNEALNVAKTGSWSWNLVNDERWWSPQMYQIVGLNPDEYSTPPDVEITNQNIHPEDRERVNQITRDAIEQGISYEIEFRFLRPDGSITYTFSRGLVERNTEGQVIRFWGISQDISDRKLAEAALRESKEQLQLALEGSGDGFWDWNIQAGEVYLSPRYLETLGYEADELPQEFSTWDRLIHPDDKPWVMETLNAHLTNSSIPYKFDYRVLTKSGEWKWIANYGKVVTRDPNGAPLRMTGTHRDVSDKKLTEIKLQQALLSAEAANRAKSVFLANMSHELRTPLNGVLGYAQILQRDKNVSPKQQDGVNIIYQCGTHLLTLINDVLDLSKIEAEKLELYPEEIHFLVFLTEISNIFQIKAVQKDIKFTYLPCPQLPTLIQTDEKRLRQVLMNLLSNAVKFTDTGSVTFQVEVMGNGEVGIGDERPTTNNQQPTTSTKIRFQVQDTGIGITSEQLAKIFLPFEQVGDSSRYAEGTGLGLAITQKLVSLMGSQIVVESTPNLGSRFWFDLDLPVVSNSRELTPIQSTKTIVGYQGKKRKILVVDDHWENCAVLSHLLKPLGFEVTTAANGQEGLEKAVEVQPDLIFVDLVMPVMDGHKMTRQLRQLPSFQTTIIIAISASAFEADRVHSRASGCNDFLPKPVRAEDLFDQIKRYLNLSWIDDQQETGDEEGLSTSIAEATPAQMVIPPPEELLALSQAALIGDISEVEQEILRLQQLNPEYVSFVTRLMRLAEEFEYEEIVNLVDSLPSRLHGN